MDVVIEHVTGLLSCHAGQSVSQSILSLIKIHRVACIHSENVERSPSTTDLKTEDNQGLHLAYEKVTLSLFVWLD